MLEKIKERLKAKFPGVKLSKTRIDAIAARLATTVTEEDAIDAALDSANNYFPFADIAKDDDRVRTLEANQKPVAPANPANPANPAQPQGDVPAWAQALIDSNKTLSEKLQTIEQGKTKETFSQRALKSFQDKKIPESFTKLSLKNLNVSTDEEFEAFVSEVESSFTEFQQSTNDTRFQNSDSPLGGGATPDTVKADISSWAAGKKEN